MKIEKLDFTNKNLYPDDFGIDIVYSEFVTYHENVATIKHNHTVWQIEFMFKGLTECDFTGYNLTLKKLEILIIPPKCFHQFKYPKRDVEYLSVKFVCNNEKLKISKPVLFKAKEEIVSVVPYLWDLIKTSKNSEFLGICLRNLIRALLEINNFSDKSLPVMDFSSKIVSILHEGSFLYPNAMEIASKLGISRQYLSKKVKEEVGMSLKPFIDNQRLDTAKLLLKFSDLTVSQISDQMGFDNIYAFSNFFKRITSKNPTDFRKKYQNEK